LETVAGMSHSSASSGKPLTLMGDTGSDKMINIQIEESLVCETLMTIDSANSCEDSVILADFFCILVMIALTGIFGRRR
jgi:hypothetical protein